MPHQDSKILPLEPGDRLTRDEFERRYEAKPELKKAELIEEEIDWFVLRSGQYERIEAGDDGILRSQTFPGLWLDDDALLRGDLANVFAVLQQGCKTAEHDEFVKRLREE